MSRVTHDESIYAQLLKHGLAAAFLTRPGDGVILYANPAACKLFGYTIDEFRGLERSAVIDMSEPKVIDALAQRLEKGYFQGVLQMLRKDGSRFSAAVASALFTDSDNKQRNSMFMWDITVQEQREEALRVINAELSRSLTEERRLIGKLPICSYCKRIRDNKDQWQNVETFIAAHAPVQFSHSICPTCYEKEILPKVESERKKST